MNFLWNTNWNDYLGDCKVLSFEIEKRLQREWSLFWRVVKFLDIYFRSLGQTIFVNNPFLGILILVSIFIGHVKAGVGCAIGGLVATLTEQILGLHPKEMWNNGVASFNGSLLGTVLPALFHLVSDNELYLWTAVCVGSMASVIISSALHNSLGQLRVPFMTLPFNFIAIISFLNFQSDHYAPPSTPDILSIDAGIDWLSVLKGSCVSMGQVYAVDSLITSIIMWIAVFLYNPKLALLSFLGSSLGTMLPLAFLEASDYSSVYSGLWGYSCILSAAAISWATFPLSGKSILAGIINVIFTVFAQKSLIQTLSKAQLPVFTLPFTLSTLLMILCWRMQGQRWKEEEEGVRKRMEDDFSDESDDLELNIDNLKGKSLSLNSTQEDIQSRSTLERINQIYHNHISFTDF